MSGEAARRRPLPATEARAVRALSVQVEALAEKFWALGPEWEARGEHALSYAATRAAEALCEAVDAVDAIACEVDARGAG